MREAHGLKGLRIDHSAVVSCYRITGRTKSLLAAAHKLVLYIERFNGLNIALENRML